MKGHGFTPGDLVRASLSGTSFDGVVVDLDITVTPGQALDFWVDDPVEGLLFAGTALIRANVPVSVQPGAYLLTLADQSGRTVVRNLIIGDELAPGSGVVAVVNPIGSATGGAARLADGVDSFAVMVTLVDVNGAPLVGFGPRLSVVAPTWVTIGAVLVNFIAADVGLATVTIGETQTATGQGFIPGEDVSVSVNSDPMQLGVFVADQYGVVEVSFAIPDGFATGGHAVVFDGSSSGKVDVRFQVFNRVDAPLGGTVVPPTTGASLVLAVLMVATGAALLIRGRQVGRAR